MDDLSDVMEVYKNGAKIQSMTQPTDAPNKIWLQWAIDGDDLPESFAEANEKTDWQEGVTWCSARQDATDIEYVLASDAKAAHAQGYAVGRASLVPVLEQALDELAKADHGYSTYLTVCAALKEIKPHD